MAKIQGGNNPGNWAHVDDNGRLKTDAKTRTSETVSAVRGEAFNVNTGNIVLTNATETPVLYLKNVGEEQELVISRVVFYSNGSTGGTGAVNTRVVYNPTGGTLLTGPTITPQNFNAGSGNQLSVDARVGSTGATLTGGTTPIRSLFPSTPLDKLLQFDPPIVIPRGSSVAFTITPPAGNTSLTAQVAYNFYLWEE